jgi:acetylornithine deacetylase
MSVLDEVTTLACDLVALDSRSFVSNLDVARCIETQLSSFEVERIDWLDDETGVEKRALVARRGAGGIAFSAHMDTVPATGWIVDPWQPRIDEYGILHGLGSADMKGPMAALLVAAKTLPSSVPVTLLLTTDEETDKEGARQIAGRSILARQTPLRGIVIAEPTSMRPVRGHRGNYNFVATATGLQAHSSTGKGRNANWDLLPFLAEMRRLQVMLRENPAWQDDQYDPPFCDLNLIIDNHGTAANVTVGRATATLMFRFSRKTDAPAIAALVQEAADRNNLTLDIRKEPLPPELPATHALVQLCAEISGASAETAPYGTDATQLQEIAPCVIMGPGNISTAHSPHERTKLSDLADSVAVYMELAERAAVEG